MTKLRPEQVKAELAKRVLARRHLLHFTKATYPNYDAGWVHEDICARLTKFSQDVEAKKSPRLMLLLPPRHGKSELASIRLPAFHIGKNPDHGVINVGYNMDLPMIFSRKVRDIFRDPSYKAMFPDAVLNPDSQATEAWQTTQGGGFICAGVGGGITGKGCFFLESPVDTPDGMRPIADLRPGDVVYGYDHRARKVIATKVLAVSAARHERGTKYYAGVRCTSDHPLYVPGAGYIAAEEIVARELPVLRRSDAEGVGEMRRVPAEAVQPGGSYSLPVLSGEESVPRQCLPPVFHYTRHGVAPATDVRALSGRIYAPCGRAGETRTPWGRKLHVLRSSLLQGLAERTRWSAAWLLRMVFRSADKARPEKILFENVLRRDADRTGGAGSVYENVAEGENRHVIEGRAHMCPDWGAQIAGSTPHRPQPGEQRSGESHIFIEEGARVLSFSGERSARDITHLVERDGYETVYDIQTATGNLFVGGILAHNCHILIIDDPIKNQEEADSISVRDKLWDWYQSTAYTRLAPGGGVLCIETWWNDDDLAGRLQNIARTDPDADQFQVVKYPALSTEWEYKVFPSWDIIRSERELTEAEVKERASGPVDKVELLRPIDTALHEERYPTAAIKRIRSNLQPRIWSALYQQNPVPDEGLYFPKENFKYVPILPALENCRLVTAWDFAIGVKQQNDWTVGATLAQFPGDKVFIVDVHRMKGDTFEIVEAMIETAQRWKRSTTGVDYTIAVEDGQIWRSIEPVFKKAMTSHRAFVPYETCKPFTDKLVRARPLQALMQQGVVYWPETAPWTTQAVGEMLRFPGGAHDDVVDAMAWAARVITARPAPRIPEPKKPPSWKDQFRRATGGKSYMTS